MIKKYGLVFGGLQQKIINLALAAALLISVIFGIAATAQNKILSEVVGESGEEQRSSISAISSQTMNETVNASLANSTALQAYIANDIFSDVACNVEVVRGFAEELFDHQDQLVRQEIKYSIADNDGIPTVQYMHEIGADEDSVYLDTVSNMGNMILSMFSESDKIDSCFVGTVDGHIIFANDRSASYVDDKGRPVRIFDVTGREWFKEAVEKGDIGFTAVTYDAYTNIPTLVCYAPVYHNGEIVAVVGADVFLDNIVDYVNSSSQFGGFICVFDEEGKVLFSPQESGPFAAYVPSSPTQQIQDKGISDFVERASAGLTGVEELSIDGTEYYVSGAPLSAVGWTVVSVLDKSVTKAPEKAMLAEYENITDRSTSTFMDKLSSLTRQTALMMIIALAVCYVISLTMANRIVKPVNSMSKKVMEIAGTSEPFEMSEMYRTSDEIQVLAESFEEMTHKNMEYIRQITDITREKERLGTELELARKIQADMLPSIFPAFPDMSDEFDVYATMTPAKEVGGDFYDFFLIDEDHLAIVMADVSGKGVPAALFMMMSKILINNYAMMGSSPARVLEQANDTICQNNDEEMFVTVWFGIYEIHTGKVIAANAGHEYPVLRSADGRFEVMKDKHGFVVGGMEGVRYKEYEFTVEKGGALFLYTDGVAEAVNENDEMFGLDRMIDTLNSDEKGDPVSLLGSMHRSLDSFVGGADQFDDITMLALVHK